MVSIIRKLKEITSSCARAWRGRANGGTGTPMKAYAPSARFVSPRSRLEGGIVIMAISYGGDHLECPTTHLALRRSFVHSVQVEHSRRGFSKLGSVTFTADWSAVRGYWDVLLADLVGQPGLRFLEVGCLRGWRHCGC